jgi:hypothetical protein
MANFSNTRIYGTANVDTSFTIGNTFIADNNPAYIAANSSAITFNANGAVTAVISANTISQLFAMASTTVVF